MRNGTLENSVRTYYENESLSDERVSAILDVSTHLNSARRWKRVAIVTSVALAAMTLLAIGLSLQHTNQTESPVVDTSESSTESLAIDNLEGSQEPGPAFDDTDREYRLIAFRTHDDGCPHCRATGEVFQQLTVALADQPIAMEQFDFSKNAERDSIDQRLAERNLTQLIEGRIETAFLAVVNKDGERIKEFKPFMGSDRIAVAVRAVVE